MKFISPLILLLAAAFLVSCGQEEPAKPAPAPDPQPTTPDPTPEVPKPEVPPTHEPVTSEKTDFDRYREMVQGVRQTVYEPMLAKLQGAKTYADLEALGPELAELQGILEEKVKPIAELLERNNRFTDLDSEERKWFKSETENDFAQFEEPIFSILDSVGVGTDVPAGVLGATDAYGSFIDTQGRSAE